jgi:hypothetical protein
MKFTLRRKTGESDEPQPDELPVGNMILGSGIFIMIICFLFMLTMIASIVKLVRNWEAFGNMSVVWLLLILFIGPIASLIFLFVRVPGSKKVVEEITRKPLRRTKSPRA